jgi:outer membrane receptor protein involved in Fe transport
MRGHRFGRNSALVSIGVALGATVPTWAFAQGDTLEEITVTGSRIVRRDYSAQTPIVTVDAEAFTQRSAIGIEATLNQLPQFNIAGSQSQLSEANTPFPSASAAPGAATLDLRGIGTNRTLVLMDGRRVQPVNGQLVVDVNTIPASAIDRVEVITGGAAAVYGADAVAGVVNFVLKRDFEGVDFNVQYGASQEGDGEETLVSGLFGSNFNGDQGNVMLGFDYARREIVYGRNRDWVVAGWNDPGTNAGGIGSSNLSTFVVDGTNAPRAPAAWLPPAVNYVIDQNGNVFNSLNPLDPAHPYTGPIGGDGPNTFKLNPDGSLGYIDREHNYLQLPLERYSIFGQGRYALGDAVEAFATARFSETFARSYGFVSSAFNVWSPTVPYNPVYDDPDSPQFGQMPPTGGRHPVPAQLADLLNSRMYDPDGPGPSGLVSGADRPWTYAGGLDYIPNFVTETTGNVYQLVGGVRGDLVVNDRDWSWEGSLSHGKTTVNARQPEGFPFQPRLQNLFNADLYGQNFDISSLPGFFPLAVTGHCTSGLPLFNADGSVNNTPSISQDCADYIVLRMNNVTTLTQDIVEFNVSGGLLEMWAGELLFAAGTTYREEQFNFDPDSGFNANQDRPNVIQNIILPVTVAGSTDVTEIYGELAIPLVSDRKLVQSFEIDPGFRRSDYSTVGTVDTYKVLFDWTVNDRLRFRGGRQVANRAPNVTELFTPRGGSTLEGNAQDACGSWPATQVWGNVPGNPNRFNLQTLCQHLMVRDGAPPTLYEPGQASANNWMYNVFGATFNFPFSIGIVEGNPNLLSEEAETLTFGMVLSFDNVTLSADLFDIGLTQAIGTPAFATIYRQCMDPAFNPLIASTPLTYTGAQLAAGNPFCALINREYVGSTPQQGATGAARTFDARYMNQGGLTSKGLDLQLDLRFDVGDGGALNTNFQATILDEYSETAFPGATPIEYTGTTFNSSFDYRVFTTVRYQQAMWGLGLRWQHLPTINPQPGASVDLRGVDSHDQLDLFADWTFSERYQLRAGIDNLTDAEPEVVGATSTNNALGSTSVNYDPFGRRYFVGLSMSF